jgi:transcriptional regulator with XRE-family HTH domain
MAIGEIVREARRKQGIGQGGLAYAVGCSAQHLSDIEHGRRAPGVELIDNLAGGLGLPFEYLLYLSGRWPPCISDGPKLDPTTFAQAMAAFREAACR